MKIFELSKIWDLFGASLSSMCLLHCLLTPLVVASFPALSHFSESHLVHTLFVVLAAPVTLWVVWNAVTHGERNFVFITAALTGLAFMISAVMISALEHVELEVTLIGATLLGSAHLWRWFQHSPE